jgi:kexin
MPDGYGRLDAGLFVEAAENWNLVKPQAWFDSPAVHLPDDPDRRRQDSDEDAPVEEEQPSEPPSGGDQEQGEGEGESESGGDPIPVVKPSGTTIPQEGVQSTYEVTQQMLDDSNLETLEHITVRVWIDHQRRGDVEVEITSPNGITSVLARVRRFDEDTTGFPGWKFMSLKHW